MTKIPRQVLEQSYKFEWTTTIHLNLIILEVYALELLFFFSTPASFLLCDLQPRISLFILQIVLKCLYFDNGNLK